MGWRNEQCRKVCRIIDDYLANRPTERDSLIVAVQKAFDVLEQAETNCSEIPNNSDIISRQMAIDALTCKGSIFTYGADECKTIISRIMTLPSAQSEIIRCKDCKYWKDSDGVYRRGLDAESKCPLNLKEVYEGTFYCGMAERRE